MAFYFAHKHAYPKLTVERSTHEALFNRSHCMKLKVGDLIDLTDGSEAVVADNDPMEQHCLCFMASMGNAFCMGYRGRVVPYTCIKTPYTEPVAYDEFLRSEWENHIKALKGDNNIDMEKFLDDLEELGIDYSAYGRRDELIASCNANEEI